MSKLQGEAIMPKFDGHEVRPGVYLIGEPQAVAGTNKLRCLANVGGALAVVELTLKFKASEEQAS